MNRNELIEALIDSAIDNVDYQTLLQAYVDERYGYFEGLTEVELLEEAKNRGIECEN